MRRQAVLRGKQKEGFTQRRNVTVRRRNHGQVQPDVKPCHVAQYASLFRPAALATL